MKLSVRVEITPRPETMPIDEMDRLMDGELTAFQTWVSGRNQAKGFAGEPLTGMERGIIKAYIIYAATDRPGDTGTEA